MSELIKTDCRFYLGDRPCKPHKEHGVHCSDCAYYDPVAQRILIIKLGAAGDVIRTTPILRRLKKEYPHASITWLTDFPDLLPSLVDEKIKFSERVVQWLSSRSFDICFSLDKDREAIALAEKVKARKKFGFGMDEYGKARAFNKLAEEKLRTGVFDDVSKRNTRSYPQEIFGICGYEFQGEQYVLDNRSKRDFGLGHRRPIVGLNTGCGARWPSRLWPLEHWTALAKSIKAAGAEYVWLGGPEEVERNKKLHARLKGHYFGVMPLEDYIGLVGQCDIVVTQVTMTLHIALGLEKKVVLLNNIFNSNEFEMYGLGVIVEPDKPCGCYYTPVCPHDSMRSITPSKVFREVGTYIQLLRKKKSH